MANFCLAPSHITAFRQGLKDGSIDPAKLSEMTSAERSKFFSKYVGEASSKDVNALFESKLLLKNQKAGFISWAKNVGGISEPARRDLLSKIERMQNVLDPQDKKAFMQDLASTKLGVNISQSEAKTIADLSKQVSSTAAKKDASGNWVSNEARLAYGRAAVDMTDYVNGLKSKTNNINYKDFLANPLTGTAKAGEHIASNAKAISASMDNSAIFRQGWKTLWTHPGIWQKNARQTFVTLVKEFGGKNVAREVTADIVSRPTFDKMMKAKLAVGNLEEAFPTTLPEKIPLFGRAYKASEVAYTTFVQKTRADVFDKYLQIAEKSGVNTNDPKELESIGRLVNSLTGRGNIGKLEPIADSVNSVFFSPRFVKSNIDTLTQVVTGGKGSNFVRKQAAVNLVKIISGTASILAVANALKPGSVELDPRSSDFGKIRIGDTRFDVTGGSGSLLTLAARVAEQSSKSSTTGKVTVLGSGAFGAKTGLDVVTNFFENKLSPAAGIVRDILKGQDFNGNKVTASNEIKNAFTPMGVQTFMEAKSDPNSANLLATLLADGLGISANTYAPQGGGGQSTWAGSSSKSVSAFKNSVSPATFTKASNQYDTMYNTWIANIKSNSQYQNMSTDKKTALITKEKGKLEASIFKANGFKYKRGKTDKSNNNLLSQ